MQEAARPPSPSEGESRSSRRRGATARRATRAERLRLGIVGCGRATESLHLPALIGVPDVEVVALSDVDDAALARVADRHHVSRRFSDPRALVEDPSIDVVAVCVPARFHAEVAVAALEAGKHVFVEKPMALDLGSCDRILAAARSARAKAVVGFNLRAHRLVAEAREILRRGDVGSIQVVESRWTSAIRAQRALPEWRNHRARGGGVLCEIAVHHFDLWCDLLGSEIEEVYVVSGAGERADESATVSARTASGVALTGVFSERTYASNELTFHGAAGRLALSLYRYDGLRLDRTLDAPGGPAARVLELSAALWGMPRAVASLRRGGEYLASYRREWEHFLAAIRGGGPVLCTLDEGRRAVRILLAAAASASTGRPVRVDDAPQEISPAVDRGE